MDDGQEGVEESPCHSDDYKVRTIKKRTRFYTKLGAYNVYFRDALKIGILPKTSEGHSFPISIILY